MVTRWLHFNKPYDQQIQDMIHSHKKEDKRKETADSDEASTQEESCVAEDSETVEEVREEERRE